MNILFREDIVESAATTAVSVANDCPLVPPPLETVDISELLCPSSRTLTRINFSIRNGVEHLETWWEVPNLSWQEQSQWNWTTYIEGGVLRNASSVQAPQPTLINRSEYGIQVQLRVVWDRLVAAPADPSYWLSKGSFTHQNKCQIIYLIILVSILEILQNHEIMGSWDIQWGTTKTLWWSLWLLQWRTTWWPRCWSLPSQEEVPLVCLDSQEEVTLVCLEPQGRFTLVCLDTLVEIPLVHLQKCLIDHLDHPLHYQSPLLRNTCYSFKVQMQTELALPNFNTQSFVHRSVERSWFFSLVRL